MVEIWSAERFRKEIRDNSGFVVVEFFRSGSPAFGSLGEALEALAESFGQGIVFGRVDVSEAEALAEKYAIRSVPTLMIFCCGRGIGEVVGEADKETLAMAICSAMSRALEKNKKS